MASIATVTLNTSTYVALGTTENALIADIKSGQVVRFATGPTTPDPATTDFIRVAGPKQFHFSDLGLGGGDEVYAKLLSGSTGLVVMRGDSNVLPPRHTYIAAGIGYVAYATPTDLFALIGSATKKVIVTSFMLGPRATAAAAFDLYFYKRITANAGGDPTATPPVKYDSASPDATAVLNRYGSAPTLGNSGGLLRVHNVLFQTITGTTTWAGAERSASLAMRNSIAGPITLRGVAESLVCNFNGAAWPAGGTVGWAVEWVEE